jgi:hypothetical protein
VQHFQACCHNHFDFGLCVFGVLREFVTGLSFEMRNCSKDHEDNNGYQYYAHVIVRIFEKTLSTHLQGGAGGGRTTN